MKKTKGKTVQMKKILCGNRAEGHVDTGIKIIIAVVIGALLLGGLYLLFSTVNVARHLGLDSEYALTRSCDKFIRRFAETEKLAEEQGINMKEADAETLDRLWKAAKETVHSR